MADPNVASVKSTQCKPEECLSLDNLIVLYIDRGASAIVPLRQVAKEFKIDWEKGTWAYVGENDDVRLPLWATFFGDNGDKGKYRIGNKRVFSQMDEMQDGVVGVYDKTNIKHLRTMLYNWYDINTSHDSDD